MVGQGCWQLGSDWGEVSEEAALGVLAAAADNGVTVFDTADVHGDGRSERLVGRFVHERGRDQFVVATRMGRRADPHEPEQYTGARPLVSGTPPRNRKPRLTSCLVRRGFCWCPEEDLNLHSL